MIPSMMGRSVDNAAIPGGEGLHAQSYAQFVAGRYNVPQGASTSATIHDDDDLAIFGNGTDASHLHNAVTIANLGYVSSYGPRGSGTIKSSRIGTTYADNTIEAWGRVATGAVVATADVGVGSVAHAAGTGIYTITLNLKNQDGGTFTCTANKAAIVATLEPTAAGAAGVVTVTPITGGVGTFVVTTYNLAGIAGDGWGFQFHVIVQ